MQITITLTKCALLIFLQSGGERKLQALPEIKPTFLDLRFQSGACDLSATATLVDTFVLGHSCPYQHV